MRSCSVSTSPYRRPSEPEVCSGQNTTSGRSRFTARGISGSSGDVGGRVLAHGRSGSSSSWRSSSISIVSGTRRPRPPVIPAVYRLIPSCRPSRRT
ncbi:hypothetical protein [Amnibacterium kyonggiense]